MIDYSVYMMTPAYSKDETPKAYAKNQVSEIWSLEKFAKHISDHNGGYSRGTVKGVISDMCECLVEQLLNGNKSAARERKVSRSSRRRTSRR